MLFVIHCKIDHIMHPAILNLVGIYFNIQSISHSIIYRYIMYIKHLTIYIVYILKYHYYKPTNI